MSIEKLISKYGIYIIIAIILLVIILIIKHIKTTNKNETQKSHSSLNFGEQEYKSTILESLPYDDRLNYSNLYNRLDSIQNTIERSRIALDQQQTDAIESIQSKITSSQIYIDNYWKTQKQKRNFYHCIGLHYASFTLADNIKREQESIRDAFVKSKLECDKLSNEIERLNKTIENAHGSYRYELMQQHKNLCSQHKRLSQIKGIFGSRNTQYLNMVKAQNNKTREYRDYIINNFGIKGRQWGDKLRNRKLDQAS